MPQATNLVDLYMEHKLAEDNLVSWSFKNFKRYKCNSCMPCYAMPCFSVHLSPWHAHLWIKPVSDNRYQSVILANDQAKKAHRRDYDKAKEAGEISGEYVPLNTLFDIAIRWVNNFLVKHHFDVKKFLRWLHCFLDFSNINDHPSLAKRNTAFFYGSSNSGVRQTQTDTDRHRQTDRQTKRQTER